METAVRTVLRILFVRTGASEAAVRDIVKPWYIRAGVLFWLSAGWVLFISLSALFGDQETLFVVHNMGQSCAYCTLWADGLNGVLGHLENRAAFVMSSPDGPEAQAQFKASRGWNFTMVSHQGTGFAEAMGYGGEEGWLPGVSVFKRQNGAVVRVSNTPFGPGDDYCAVWNLFDLIPEGSDGWQPRFSY